MDFKIEDILVILSATVAVILILWYVFGQSPTIDQIILGLVFVNLGFTFKMWGDFQKHIGEHKGSGKN